MPFASKIITRAMSSSAKPIKTVAIIGSGLMGSGIAQVGLFFPIAVTIQSVSKSTISDL